MIKRSLQIDILPKTPVFLWGARKTGKSTFLKKVFSQSVIFDLLDSELFYDFSKKPSFLREIVLALDTKQRLLPIIIDEVQKVPPLLDEVHKLTEDHKLSFILSGSSARKLKKGRANLLGGRALRHELYPLTSHEIPHFDLLTALRRGTIPDHYLNRHYHKLLKSYVIDYLNEEIREEGLSRNLPAFSRFLEAAGFSAGELVNYSNIARECGVDAKTVREYFQILCDTLIGYLIEPFTGSKKRDVITKSPKFYLFDVGVANQVAKRSFATLKGVAAGKALENFILSELIAYRSYQDLDFDINFWRTKSGTEVDFVLGKGQVALEIKISPTIQPQYLNGLSSFCESHSCQRSILVCQTSRKRIIKDKNNRQHHVWPILSFLEALWKRQII